MTKRISSLMLSILLIASMVTDTFAAYMPRTKTPDYKVAFYAFDCYHMQDENGKRSGYGYEMMQGLSKCLQCTFSYVGYDKSASECEEMLRNGDRAHQRPLINDEVDALVNSYIRIPENEKTVENFGETPYYIMVRREDTALTEQLDYAIGRMNEALPNWRTELYNKYYGAEENAREFTADELALLGELRADGTVLRAVMAPNANP